MKIFIWGASGQGRVVLDIIREAGEHEVSCFVDSNPEIKGKRVDGIEVLGGIEILDSLKGQGAIVAIGNNTSRCQVSDLLRQRGFFLINAIHPRALISRTCKISSGTTIASGAMISTHAILEDDVLINTGAIIEHENIIRRGSHIAPGSKLAGLVEVGEKAFVGIGATIIQRRKIGALAIIGAGSVVLEDVLEKTMVAGVPARVIREVTENDLKNL